MLWGQMGIWEISIPSPQFYCEPETDLIKHKVLKNIFNIV